jgi:hypothetical protein
MLKKTSPSPVVATPNLETKNTFLYRGRGYYLRHLATKKKPQVDGVIGGFQSFCDVATKQGDFNGFRDFLWR